jgi:16S rRNA G527 N7-methylase RsmG
MGYASVRTSMSLDHWTVQFLKEVSEKLNISKAEVIRRSVRQFKEKIELEETAPSPLEAFDWLQYGGGMVAEEAAEYRAEVKAEREARKYWWES